MLEFSRAKLALNNVGFPHFDSTIVVTQTVHRSNPSLSSLLVEKMGLASDSVMASDRLALPRPTDPYLA